MDELFLARLQFGSTTIFHFLFVPLSIGLVFLVALFETHYVLKGDERYKKLAKFWGHLFLINFAVGVVTGIIQEFQFGMNWSEYSRFVGDVFGAPLAIEALLAFFMESTFIGLWIFGWDRLSKKVHLACIWLVSLGTMMSALWILAANSFMQEPVGFAIKNGRAEMNDFFALLTNPQLAVEFPHVIFGALATGAFFIGGISAYKIIKGYEVDLFKRSFNLAMTVALISGLAIAFTGHAQAKHLMESQPMKMAASEALWEDSGDPASWTAFAFIDSKNQENSFEINIPFALSYLAYEKFQGDVPGMKTLQAEYEAKYGEGNYIPPVKTTFWSFRIMVGAGMVMILASVLGLYFSYRETLVQKKWFLRGMVALISFPFIANSAGWIMTEIGRQPWTVFGLMTTSASVSPNVSAQSLLLSLIAFSLAYTILAIVLVYLFVREIKKGVEHHEAVPETQTIDPFDQEVYM
ncbi:cytochrome ubiquinol oxidase subunit I [Domibacillus sp. DTU_2020_1001157_1_SI_ALB_TIR_016]|uniref:cytochrome ubiquinol oxidase subunit I n=1 Tax=Domibacillus sp. DTU_2020_1001157_1_SI_ALB_TIR_016 TaxID=3077789 RepID=UPI0028E4F343|nr:cytochrome ubiquinol oxidase subunit I [Domibacillus sp. DTU_2020_1001157_1_SI_ALB_TIR_016]WNS80984.1 cytochrome ubiquinol oxidase subunit I [Domibacillus sp. DTU_2020_1001157_1_SI_ALB_TIR_016]